MSTPGAGTNQAASAESMQPKLPLNLSPAAAQVLKLIQAGVSKPVIEAYIGQAPVTEPLNASDLVALKEHGVSDDLTLALLKRASAISGTEAQVASVPGGTADGSPTGPQRVAYSSLDPESYDFWVYHYAYPRALAAANDRVFSSYRPFYQSLNYGFYPPLPFPPQPPHRSLGGR